MKKIASFILKKSLRGVAWTIAFMAAIVVGIVLFVMLYLCGFPADCDTA